MIDEILNKILDNRKKPLAMVNLGTNSEFENALARTYFQDVIQGPYCGVRKICFDGGVGIGLSIWTDLPHLKGKFDVSLYSPRNHILPLTLYDELGNEIITDETYMRKGGLYVSPSIIETLNDMNDLRKTQKNTHLYLE